MVDLDPSPSWAVGTDRLVLRAPVAADVLAIAELANDLGVAAMTCTMPHPFQPTDAEALLAKAAIADPRRRADFVVEHRQFGVVGMLGFRTEAPGRPRLRGWLGRPFRGRGYATEALTGALVWARGDWGRSAVWAGHFAEDRAAGLALCKAGFLYTGDVVRTPSRARDGALAATRMMVWLA